MNKTTKVLRGSLVEKKLIIYNLSKRKDDDEMWVHFLCLKHNESHPPAMAFKEIGLSRTELEQVLKEMDNYEG